MGRQIRSCRYSAGCTCRPASQNGGAVGPCASDQVGTLYLDPFKVNFQRASSLEASALLGQATASQTNPRQPFWALTASPCRYRRVRCCTPGFLNFLAGRPTRDAASFAIAGAVPQSPSLPEIPVRCRFLGPWEYQRLDNRQRPSLSSTASHGDLSYCQR